MPTVPVHCLMQTTTIVGIFTFLAVMLAQVVEQWRHVLRARFRIFWLPGFSPLPSFL